MKKMRKGKKMKMMINKKAVFLVVTALALAGCGGGGDTTPSVDVTIPTTYTPNDGRLLGSAGCAQCHGTNGYSVTAWDSIAGEGEFATEDFSEHPIMQTIANGYTIEEKHSIDSWLNSLPEYDND